MFDVYEDLVELVPELGAEERRVLDECDRAEASYRLAEERRYAEHHGAQRPALRG